MSDLTERITRAAEAILGNETLTSDLEDEAAQVLLDWGVACATALVQSTADLDEVAAQRAYEDRSRSLRRMLKRINKWAATSPTAEPAEGATRLDEIVAPAAEVYGSKFRRPAPDTITAFEQWRSSQQPAPAQLIPALRHFLETGQVPAASSP